MVATATVVSNREPWRHKSFIKEKLFVRERYWHKFHMLSSTASSTDDTSRSKVDIHPQQQSLVIPSGAVWRKYLKLWMAIADTFPNFRLVLLESAVECMDWRNSSPCICTTTEIGEIMIPEATAIQEKTRLRKMLETEKVTAFCDLAVRDEEFDEFDLLNYPHMYVEDRSRSALLRAGRMLQQGSDVVVVMETSDLEYLHHEELDIRVVESFFDQLCESVSSDVATELLNMKEQCEENYRRRNAATNDTKVGVEDYLSIEDIQKGIRDGSLARGRLDVTTQNFKEAYVRTPKGLFFINQGEGHFNRAIHQDVVVIKPLPESQWGRPVGRRRLVFNPDSEENDASDDASIPTVPSAVVVAIAEPSRRRYVATLVDTPSAEDRAVIVVPVDTRIPRIRLQTRSWQKLQSQRLLVEIDNWDVGSNYPNGHCIDILGPYGDLETEIKCLLLEREINLAPFSNNAIALLPPEGPTWRIPKDEITVRRDLRKTCRIFSVDPVGCQDIDDTMHVRVLPNGDFEVGVHIADVAYFVPQNSALDKEAQVRATTFYLVDRRFDMLPSLLSSNLCSLHGDTDRLAVSVIWTMTPDFEQIKNTWFGRSVIHNCQAMTYEQAHSILHDKPPDDQRQPQCPPLTAGYRVEPKSIATLKHDLLMLTTFTRKLRKKREEVGGAVDLTGADLGSELKFALDENGNPVKVSAKKELEIHHTIAELMILANQSVAEKIYRSFPNSSLLRIHRTVEQNKLEDLETFLKAGGTDFDGSSNMAMAKSLKNARMANEEQSAVNALWQSLATRAMSEAEYISTGSVDPGISLSHYGLGIEKYTHFTSPIRRYADMVVHRQLLAALANDCIEHAVGPPPGFSARPALHSIPLSTVISIYSGEGLGVLRRDESETAVSTESADPSAGEIVRPVPERLNAPVVAAPYDGGEVARICLNLNVQNRRATISSMECQKLFLSLFFNDRVANAKAVVMDVRANGMVVFVPQFDMKGPVYLCDEIGHVQLDPTLVGLPADSGIDPTVAFSVMKTYRRFPSGQTVLTECTDVSKSKLEVFIPEAAKRLQFRVLDVVTVQISCDLRDAKARVPSPRLHLVAPSAAGPLNGKVQHKITSASIHSTPRVANPQPINTLVAADSIYEHIAALPIGPILPDAPPSRPRKAKSDFQSSIGGRKRFGDFVNPDTRVAQQEAAISAASYAVAQLRLSANQSHARNNEFDSVRSVERNVTARAQKLAAGKRNTRKAK